MSETPRATLYSGGAIGSEAAFGVAAEASGLDEVTFCFAGHEPTRQRGLRMLSAEDLALRDVSVQYVSKLMGRSYPSHTDEGNFKALIQSICWQVISGQEVFVVGEILPDLTVRGGTGWGAEFAKLCDKPLYVFDQQRLGWFRWEPSRWNPVRNPVVSKARFTGTGTRSLTEAGAQAISELFSRSFR
ncbi:MAG TPA: hypothetical protein VN419_11050 [Humidesulfovibrio sp.]|uniref:hypothetical protein n=1 Tax=Humidesulfovibrio sp. TaxID=2910988 RepID=UPI002C20161C|nr:hypothetical protein [Humidesulfovibrio sp.]HWR04545.1 hypothetical protein [Humidesulfovibrio sp.]